MSFVRRHSIALCLCLTSLFMPPVLAEDNEIYLQNKATQQDYIDALKKTRGIRPITAEDVQSQSAAPGTQAAALSIKVYFEYGSATLTPAAKKELDNLGAALTAADFSGDVWRIEGHTDAAGNAQYNQLLSERRAISVHNYLTRNFAIEPARLVPVGKGETELYDSNNPNSSSNRRVRIKYLGG